MPEVSSSINLTVDGTDFDSRIEMIDGKTAIVAIPVNGTVEPPEIGSFILLGWGAGERGRYVVETTLVSTSRVEGVPGRCWTLSIESEPMLHQRRRYVRAGGGESVRVRAKEHDAEISGFALDISEGGVRFRIPGVKPGEDNWTRLADREAVSAVIRLGDDMLDADGSVLRTIEDAISQTVDMIVTLRLSERQAEVVRRYVMRQQILARRAAAEDDY
ncbi:PilZ domain-containing protein [Planosporangium thailandense]|uniref:PilZ domain-containing protein n=1 Tax=Planosporangium thailandense TaxID=765197 RepID=A0ABX0Y2G8_9ACTN|nr:PilZ domain-containing protein [Planosporangium thailandense]NJC71770.1 PilZ domain-containing protein [Planosporangium thailandense]